MINILTENDAVERLRSNVNITGISNGQRFDLNRFGNLTPQHHHGDVVMIFTTWWRFRFTSKSKIHK